MKRSQDEIVARISEIAPRDMLGWSRELLIGYLDFEHARPFLVGGTSREDWEPRTDPKQDCVDYLDFAWGKANNERGISSERSVDKITQWLWLIGDETLAASFARADYTPYGKPKLQVVTNAFAGVPRPTGEG